MKTMIALLVGLAAASPLAAQDTLKFKDPKKNADLEGKIVTLAFDLIEIELPAAGGPVKQPVDPRLVREIVPAKSFDFLKGEEALANGDFNTAILRYQRVAADTRAMPAQRQLADLKIVQSRFAAEDYPSVVDAAQTLRGRRPDGFYVGESFDLEIRALIALKNPAAAKAAIAQLAALGNARAQRDWVTKADLDDAWLAEFQKNWRGALAIYQKHGRDPEVAEQATLGEFRCLTAIPNLPALGARANAVLKEAAGDEKFPSRVLIAAYTGKADVDFAGGKVKAALFGYLQGALSLAKGETSPEHERSVAQSALACVALAAEDGPDQKRTYRERAMDLLRELKKTYPASRYRVEIEEALRKLQ